VGCSRDMPPSACTKLRGYCIVSCNTLPIVYCYENNTVCHSGSLHGAVMVARLSKLGNRSRGEVDFFIFRRYKDRTSP
jgi:hypothetical protein